MADPLYSNRWTELYTVTPEANGQLILDGDAAEGNMQFISGFMVTTDGTITVVGINGGASQTLTVLAGVQYFIACRSVLAASGTGTIIGAR